MSKKIIAKRTLMAENENVSIKHHKNEENEERRKIAEK
jgi:hypothetical protein